MLRLAGPRSITSPSWLAQAEPLLVALAAPLLLFPRGVLPWFGFGVLLLGWITRGVGTHRWFDRTPLDRPILAIFLMVFVSIYPSVDWQLSLPKLCGILLGVAVYYATARAVSSPRDFWMGVSLVVASVVPIAILGLIGTDWTVGKYGLPAGVYSRIPRVIQQVQTSVGTSSGFNPNELGITLAFLLPVPTALLLRPSETWGRRILLAIPFALGGAVLVLTGSRSALLGTVVAMIALVVWRDRRFGLGIFALAVTSAVVVIASGSVPVGDLLLKLDSTSGTGVASLPSRAEVWGRAIEMIRDFPFTGIGLNTFPVVLDALYPSFYAGPGVIVPHAHDVYLQTALDLGLGGLGGFIGLWVLAGWLGWMGYRAYGAEQAGAQVQAAIVGLLGGFLAYLVAGLTDATMLGTKPTVLLWLMLGLVVAVNRLPAVATGPLGPTAEHQEGSVLSFVRLVLAGAGDLYWVVTYFLVAMGLVVVALDVLRWP